MTVLAGPAWSLEGLQVAAGRFPLAVEQHVLRMVSLLVPGTTTVTPHGRYYCLHALAAVEGADRKLSAADSFDLLRRMELALGAVSVVHEESGGHHGFPRPHGADVIAPRLRAAGQIDVAELSKPGKGGYVQHQAGFWAPYLGSEVLLGIVASGGALGPGPRCDPAAVRDGLGDLVTLANMPVLTRELLAETSHLCLCAGGSAPDGAWLRRLLCNPGTADDGVAKADQTRRATARILTRVIGEGASDITSTFIHRIGFGAFVNADPIVASHDEALAWRGVVLRHYAVGAWRRLWAWLVEQVDDLVTVDDVADAFADHLPGTTVSAFRSHLPATTDASGQPANAEDAIRASTAALPVVELGVLAISALRNSELDGIALEAFRGRPVELAPTWTARRFDDAAGADLRDFGRALVRDLIVRARRVAMSKAVRRRDGTIWYPTRLHEKGGLLWRTSHEGAGDVGLRVAQLSTVLAGAGVLAWRDDDGSWAATAEGIEVLA